LKAPHNWRFSHFKTTGSPVLSRSASDRSDGVFLTLVLRKLFANRISVISGTVFSYIVYLSPDPLGTLIHFRHAIKKI
jgi:hypothetical protein